MMLDTIFSEIVRIVSFVVEPHNCSNAKFLEDRNVIIGSKSTILDYSLITPYLSIGLSEGELKATNFWGRIQLRSPFYIFS